MTLAFWKAQPKPESGLYEHRGQAKSTDMCFTVPKVRILALGHGRQCPKQGILLPGFPSQRSVVWDAAAPLRLLPKRYESYQNGKSEIYQNGHTLSEPAHSGPTRLIWTGPFWAGSAHSDAAARSPRALYRSLNRSTRRFISFSMFSTRAFFSASLRLSLALTRSRAFRKSLSDFSTSLA